MILVPYVVTGVFGVALLVVLVAFVVALVGARKRLD